MTRPGALVLAALDLVLPHRCAACGDEPAGSVPALSARAAPLCDGCRARLRAALHPPRAVAPRPRPPGLPAVHAGASYGGVVAALLRAWKDGGRRDLHPLLADLLLPVLRAATPPGALLVPVPTSPAARRRRGDAPLLDLLVRTAPGLGPGTAVDALRVARRVADQSGLDHRARAANLDHALVARPSADLDGRPVVLVDDVLTTGATLAEAARAVREAGGHPLGAAVLAATRRRRDVERRDDEAGTGSAAGRRGDAADAPAEPGGREPPAAPARWTG